MPGVLRELAEHLQPERLDQTEQRGLRGYEAQPCLILGQPVQAAVQRVSVLVQQLIEATSELQRG